MREGQSLQRRVSNTILKSVYIRVKDIEVYGWKLKVGREKVKIFDDEDVLTDEEAMNIVRYLYDEGILSSSNIECEIISRQ